MIDKHLVLMGVCGTGKTVVGEALCKKLDRKFVDADSFHHPESIAKMAKGIPLEDTDRWVWLDRLNATLKEHKIRSESVILACSALKEAYRNRLSNGVDIRWVYIKVPYELISKRLAARQRHFMGANLLDSQLKAFEEPNGDALTVVDTGFTPEVVAGMIVRELRQRQAI